LIETVAAVRLLGAEVVLTGVRPVIAQTLVHLGVDLSNITTRSSLRAGLKVALAMLDLAVCPKPAEAAVQSKGNYEQ
jgi:rsbT co-antagonist protein RsbR